MRVGWLPVDFFSKATLLASRPSVMWDHPPRLEHMSAASCDLFAQTHGVGYGIAVRTAVWKRKRKLGSFVMHSAIEGEGEIALPPPPPAPSLFFVLLAQ